MNKRIVAGIVLTMLILTAFEIIRNASAETEAGTLSGHVYDSWSNPIQGARVRVFFHSTYEEDYTDSSGYYCVVNIGLCYCLKTATASKKGYTTESVSLGIWENSTHDFILTFIGNGSITWTVDDDGLADFSSLQQAIDSASVGDAIQVAPGIYHENVRVWKTLTIIGEDKTTTIIDGNKNDTVVYFDLTHGCGAGTIFAEFTVQGSGEGLDRRGYLCAGIRVLVETNCSISNNIVRDNYVGFDVRGFGAELRNNNMTGNVYNFEVRGINNISTSNTVDGKPILCLVNMVGIQIPLQILHDVGYIQVVSSERIIIRNLEIKNVVNGIDFVNTNNSLVENVTIRDCYRGIYLLDSYFNEIKDNNIIDCDDGIRIVPGKESDNKIYHNNFINNSRQAYITDSRANIWDDGCEGNYWSDYEGTDADGDGIGDTPYFINDNNQDNYPLMFRWWNPCDINSDGRVNILDIARTAKAFGSEPGHANWNPRADLGRNGNVEYKDLQMIADEFGKSY